MSIRCVLLSQALPSISSLTTHKNSTQRPMVHHTHPTHMEDPPPQTTHSCQLPQPPKPPMGLAALSLSGCTPSTAGGDTGLANSIGPTGLSLSSGANVIDDGGRPVPSPTLIPPPPPAIPIPLPMPLKPATVSTTASLAGTIFRA